MTLINKKGLKIMFEKRGIKIGNGSLRKFADVLEANIEGDADKAVRAAKISGRKVVKIEDF